MSVHAPKAAVAVAAVLASLLLLGLSPVQAAEHGRRFAPTPLEGLTGVLGLAVGQDGSIYTSESFAGQLTRTDKRGNRTILAQTQVAGVDAVGRGNVVFTEAFPPEFGGLADTYLSRVTPQGRVTRIASLSAYEEAVNPDGDQTYGLIDTSGVAACLVELQATQPDAAAVVAEIVEYQGHVDSNPYAVATVPGGWLVADAGGNTILRVSANGQVSTVAVLPPQDPITIDEEVQAVFEEVVGWMLADPDAEEPVPVDLGCLLGETYIGEAVPTDVEVGPDGHYYVTTLPGLPELPGTGGLWRIHSQTGELTLVAGGFTGAVDLAVADDGTIYVAELFASQISVVRDGAVVDTLSVPLPAAVEVGPDGAVYAAIGTFFGPGAGSVIQIGP